MDTQCYCIALRRSSRKLQELYDAALAPLGITIGQFSQLRNIRSLQPVSLTDLARRLELDRSTVGRNTKVLEKMGLVQPAAAEDQRESAVVLTAEGEALLDRATPLWEAQQRRIEERLGPDTFERVAELLDTIA